MHPPSPSPVLRLHPCRRQWIGVLVLCLGLLGIGVAMLATDAGAGWFVAAVSGVGAAAAIVALLPGVTDLQLDAEGITLRALFRRRRFDWTTMPCASRLRFIDEVRLPRIPVTVIASSVVGEAEVSTCAPCVGSTVWSFCSASCCATWAMAGFARSSSSADVKSRFCGTDCRCFMMLPPRTSRNVVSDVSSGADDQPFSADSAALDALLTALPTRRATRLRRGGDVTRRTVGRAGWGGRRIAAVHHSLAGRAGRTGPPVGVLPVVVGPRIYRDSARAR